MVVPGSGLVKAQAEAEGLDRIFRDAGFEWREPGCSMCLAMNDDKLEPGERCASTSNRNFEGRQGAGGRTHLVSPAMAAAAAVAGHFVDIRRVYYGIRKPHATLPHPHRTRRAARPRERRHRRDHPEAVPEVDQAVGLRPQPVRRMALPRSGRARHRQREAAAQSEVRAERGTLPGRIDPARAAQLRLRQLARARAVGARRLRLSRGHRAVVRRHLLQQLLQERPAADGAAGVAGGAPVRRYGGRFPASS